MTFTREFTRYIVVKSTDANRYLTAAQRKALAKINIAIDDGRHKDKRGTLKTVVIESNWPEYEPAWRAIEARVELEEARKKFTPMDKNHAS